MILSPEAMLGLALAAVLLVYLLAALIAPETF
jgi:K+-transporting ATPase KdpF subunit